jgi:hypothetical protein
MSITGLLFPLAGLLFAAGTIPALPAGDGGDGGRAEQTAEAEQLVRFPIPANETLVYEVMVDLGALGKARAGKVTLRASRTEPRPDERSGMATPPADPDFASLPGDPEPPPAGWIRSTAEGEHLGYRLHEEITTKILDVGGPRSVYEDVQSGSENRRRVLVIGASHDPERALFRGDRHCKGCARPEHFVDARLPWGKPHHCKKCKRAEHRVWKEPKEREVPPGTVDMLSAVYLARTFLEHGKSTMSLLVLDQTKLWSIILTRGDQRVLHAPAGSFQCVEISLAPERPPGEPDREIGRFAGLFGIQGTLKIWVEAETGVPVRVEGSVPLGPFEPTVRAELASYSGTPEGFAPVR